MFLRCTLLGLAVMILRIEESVGKSLTKDGNQEVPSLKEEVVPSLDNNLASNGTNSSRSGDLTEKEKKEYVKELVGEISTVIAENIEIAINTIAEKGDVLSDNDTKEFFETVAGHVLVQIEERINTLKEIVQDQDLVARGIAEDIAKKITKNVNSQTMTDLPSGVKDNVITGGVIGIPKEIEFFIKQILTSPA